MSIAIRNFEETDLDAVRSLMEGQAGPSLAKSAYLQPDHIRSAMLADNIFALVAEENQKPNGTTSIFMEQESPQTVVGLLCRLCITDTPSRPEMATTLVHTALESLKGNLQVCFAEIPSKLLWAQAACEQAGFITSGYLPAKFNLEDRWGAVVYMYLTEEARNARRPHPEIISGARDLANEVLKAHGIIEDAETRDDVVAYPTEGNLTIAPIDSTAVSTMVEGLSQPATKIFRFLQGTQTLYHLPATEISYLAAREDGRVIGVIGYAVDPIDRRIQLVEMITLDGEPEGLMVAHLLEQFSGNDALDYWEVLVSAHAPRMQKTFDQLGFVPCAYLPAFGMEHGMRSDAIKMVKLNAGYETDHSELTSSTKKIFSLIDTIFREYSIGFAVLKLLRDLRIFRGLGEGELRRVARLFSQKLLRPGEVLFEEGSTGREMYVVERGEIEITTKEGKLLGVLKTGAVVGEMAFLNGEPRSARCVSKSATIVRVIHRSDFDRLIQREVHLGLIFFQNIALDLAEKLRQMDLAHKGK